MNNKKFWKSPPPPLSRDLRAWSLLIPAAAASVGSIAYTLQGLAASQGGALPATWVAQAIPWGAVLLAVGCEGGTLSSMVEVARKKRSGQHTPEDAIAFWVSLIATVTARIMSVWPSPSVITIGVLVVASALDAYMLMREYGDYTGIRDEAMLRWEKARFLYEEQGDADGALAALRGDSVPSASPLQQRITELETLNVNGEQAYNELAQQYQETRAALAQLEEEVLATDYSDWPKAAAARHYLQYHPQASREEIARAVGCSAETVRKAVTV